MFPPDVIDHEWIILKVSIETLPTVDKGCR